MSGAFGSEMALITSEEDASMLQLQRDEIEALRVLSLNMVAGSKAAKSLNSMRGMKYGDFKFIPHSVDGRNSGYLNAGSKNINTLAEVLCGLGVVDGWTGDEKRHCAATAVEEWSQGRHDMLYALIHHGDEFKIQGRRASFKKAAVANLDDGIGLDEAVQDALAGISGSW